MCAAAKHVWKCGCWVGPHLGMPEGPTKPRKLHLGTGSLLATSQEKQGPWGLSVLKQGLGWEEEHITKSLSGMTYWKAFLLVHQMGLAGEAVGIIIIIISFLLYREGEWANPQGLESGGSKTQRHPVGHRGSEGKRRVIPLLPWRVHSERLLLLENPIKIQCLAKLGISITKE